MNAGVMPRASGAFGAMAAGRSSLLAGVLSVLVHGGLVLALVLGVSWRNTPNQPVQAEIWTRLPEPAVVSRPEPVVETQAQTPPQAEPPVRKPDIALKPIAKPKAKPTPKPAPKTPAPKTPVAKTEPKKSEKLAREKQKLEQHAEARQALEKELLREEEEALAAELAQVQAVRRRSESQARTAAQIKAMAIRDGQDRIRLKIRGLLRIPEGVKGNPEVVYRVRLFPNGEIMGAPERLQSSGQPAYDAAVEAAILKASPLPLPTSAGVAADFRVGLELRFRPREE